MLDLLTAHFHLVVTAWAATALLTFAALFFVTAPYGRHARSGWGPVIPERLGWMLMELPSPVLFALLFALGTANEGAVAWVFLTAWIVHYGYRAFAFPFTLRVRGTGMPASIAVFGAFFNVINAPLNAWWIFEVSGGYDAGWLADPRFVVGSVLFVWGLVVNRHADAVLRSLRKPGETGYKIPHGGLYRYISCPNYFGEIVQWIGWAIATWSLPGLAFAVWTFANLAPRAIAHHRWYREKFADYPPERRALIPGVW